MHGVFASGLFNISLSSVINFALVSEQKAASVMRNGGQRRAESGPECIRPLSFFQKRQKNN